MDYYDNIIFAMWIICDKERSPRQTRQCYSHYTECLPTAAALDALALLTVDIGHFRVAIYDLVENAIKGVFGYSADLIFDMVRQNLLHYSISKNSGLSANELIDEIRNT